MKIAGNDIIKSIVYPLITFLIGAVIMYYFTKRVDNSSDTERISRQNQSSLIETKNDLIETKKCLTQKADKLYVDQMLRNHEIMMKSIEERQVKFNDKFDDMYSKIIDLWKENRSNKNLSMK